MSERDQSESVTSNQARPQNGTASSSSSGRDYEERRKQAKAREAIEFEKRREQLLASQQKAEEVRKRRNLERRQKIEENKRREAERRQLVESRRLEIDKAKLAALKRRRELEERLSRLMNSRHRGCFASSHDPELQCLLKICDERSDARSAECKPRKHARSRSVSCHFMLATKASMLRSVTPFSKGEQQSARVKSISSVETEPKLQAEQVRMRTKPVPAKRTMVVAKPQQPSDRGSASLGSADSLTGGKDSGLALSISEHRPTSSVDEEECKTTSELSQMSKPALEVEPEKPTTDCVSQSEVQKASPAAVAEEIDLLNNNVEQKPQQEEKKEKQEEVEQKEEEEESAKSEAVALAAVSNSAGEGSTLTGDAAALYKARFEEQRRIAREKLEQEQR
ncbi:hypothetical protein Ciccas_001270 [Cichlidogyrus casuarinus]|uniref:Ensconsin n=1 Tax=Cichlidogyrus casuarinus TaxID=1844966 RepID=A0ABD2QL18_9PLAT